MKCPRCGSEKIWKKGLVPTVKGPKARFTCTKCGHTFYTPKRKRATTKKAKTA
jgi:transposase-like protein